MLASLNEKKSLIISILVIVLDGLIIYFIPSYFNKINYLYPMLTISLIPFIYAINKKKYYYLIITMGILYDLLYSSVFLYNVVLFYIIVSIDVLVIKSFKNNLLLFIILSLFNIIFYDLIGFLLILLTSYQSITILDLIYKIKHSMLLNILSVFVFWFLFKKNI